jgi:hypothetical protein
MEDVLLSWEGHVLELWKPRCSKWHRPPEVDLKGRQGPNRVLGFQFEAVLSKSRDRFVISMLFKVLLLGIVYICFIFNTTQGSFETLLLLK